MTRTLIVRLLMTPLVFALAVREPGRSCLYYNPRSSPVIEEFSVVFSEDLLNRLLPMHDIQHDIDLFPGSTLPNFPHYRLNPTEHTEFRRLVNDLLERDFIQESLIPCSVSP